MTADCAITAVEEVALRAGARHGGGRHRPPRAARRRRCCRTRRSCIRSSAAIRVAELCATAVAYKLAQASVLSRGRDARARADLDLVALATIADVVPLLGENRTLVRRGLRALAGTAKPGLRALMAVARVDPARVDERAVAFALAPRLNAAGRLYRADAGLELILTEDRCRAAQVAHELDRANQRASRRRAGDPVRGRSADRGAHGYRASGALRARGRGLARRRDRDRRLASGRAAPQRRSC